MYQRGRKLTENEHAVLTLVDSGVDTRSRISEWVGDSIRNPRKVLVDLYRCGFVCFWFGARRTGGLGRVSRSCVYRITDMGIEALDDYRRDPGFDVEEWL